MRVCMVSDHGCIRVSKMGRALAQAGHLVELLTHSGLPFGFDAFTTVGVWADEAQLRRAVMFSKAQVFHVHNEPDWFVAVVKEAAGGRPVIYDVHDLESLRNWGSGADKHELAAFAAADGIIHVSEPCKQIAEQTHPESAKKPNRVIYSFVNEMFVQDAPLPSPCWHSVVYEGGVSADEFGPTRSGEKGYNMRWYVPVAQALQKAGLAFTVYAASGQDVGTAYQDAGAVVAEALQYPTLLRALRIHGWGLVGAVHSFPLMHAAVPNKLFEYISQGVVPLVLNSETSAAFVRSYQCGIVLDGLEQIEAQIQDYDWNHLRQNVLALRSMMTMETQVSQLIALYEEVL